jgi:hypothetical protein
MCLLLMSISSYNQGFWILVIGYMCVDILDSLKLHKTMVYFELFMADQQCAFTSTKKRVSITI